MTAADVQVPATAQDVLVEARLLVAEARERGLPVRLLGGTAIQLRGRGRLPPALARAPDDIDLLGPRGVQPEVTALLTERGYVADEAFNRLEGSRRLLFRDARHDRQVDVFVGGFEMCHALPLCERLELEEMTLPLAELALTKLQIVELNDKDCRDLYALLAAHDVGREDGPCVNVARIAGLCAEDWGLWRTCTLNLGRLREGLASAPLDPPLATLIRARVDALERAIETAPKSRRWRLRAKVGDRLRWYEVPDEIEER